MEQAAKVADERDMVATDPSSTRRQLDTAVRDLDAADRRSQAIHREKLETVSRLRGELVKERSEVEKVQRTRNHNAPRRNCSLEQLANRYGTVHLDPEQQISLQGS